jgi:hypothetical protein
LSQTLDDWNANDTTFFLASNAVVVMHSDYASRYSSSPANL